MGLTVRQIIMHRIWIDGTEFRWTKEIAVPVWKSAFRASKSTSVSKRTSKPDPSAMHSPSLLRLLEISQVRRRLVLPGWH
jgi:hypothetical protein